MVWFARRHDVLLCDDCKYFLTIDVTVRIPLRLTGCFFWKMYVRLDFSIHFLMNCLLMTSPRKMCCCTRVRRKMHGFLNPPFQGIKLSCRCLPNLPWTIAMFLNFVDQIFYGSFVYQQHLSSPCVIVFGWIADPFVYLVMTLGLWIKTNLFFKQHHYFEAASYSTRYGETMEI